jgi:hypothetical protein
VRGHSVKFPVLGKYYLADKDSAVRPLRRAGSRSGTFGSTGGGPAGLAQTAESIAPSRPSEPSWVASLSSEFRCSRLRQNSGTLAGAVTISSHKSAPAVLRQAGSFAIVGLSEGPFRNRGPAECRTSKTPEPSNRYYHPGKAGGSTSLGNSYGVCVFTGVNALKRDSKKRFKLY